LLGLIDGKNLKNLRKTMNRSILFVIDDDPRESGRPAEAIRIAAGVGLWDKVNVSVYLRDAAVLILGENTDDLVDADNYERYLPLLAKPDRPIYAQSGSPALKLMEKGPFLTQEISDAELTRLAAEHSQVIRF
jgi:sulfur relay (sulfurtransferase) DsrF/TusC family protein